MGKFNYYDDDINMIYQATPQKSGEALYEILESLGSYGYTYNEVNNRINKQLNELGISSKDDLFKVLDEIADLWIKASTTGYKEEGWLLGREQARKPTNQMKKVIQKFLEKNSNLKFFLNLISHAQKLFLLDHL